MAPDSGSRKRKTWILYNLVECFQTWEVAWRVEPYPVWKQLESSAKHHDCLNSSRYLLFQVSQWARNGCCKRHGCLLEERPLLGVDVLKQGRWLGTDLSVRASCPDALTNQVGLNNYPKQRHNNMRFDKRKIMNALAIGQKALTPVGMRYKHSPSL